MKYEDQLIVLLTDEQVSAIKSLERAFKKCKRANLYIHNYYGDLYGYNGKFIKKICDTPSAISFDEIGASINAPDYNLQSWSDDNNYVHLKEWAMEEERAVRVERALRKKEASRE